MPVPFVACRNKVTGATADVPETALIHMTNWVPIGQDDPPAESTSAQAASPPADTPAPRAQSKPAAKATDNTKE